MPPTETMLTINSRLQIPLLEFQFTFSRSSGPGGQNVNKVNSKAMLRWDATTSPSLVEPLRSRVLAALRSRLTLEGVLVIQSQRYRDAPRNVDDCLERLRTILRQAAAPVVPRRPTKPTRGSIRRRLQDKRQRSDKKDSRRPGSFGLGKE